MKKIITKELLRRVLPKETENLSEDFSFYIDEDYIVFRDEGETLFDYNVYKFVFKCKEWVLTLENKFPIKSMTSITPSGTFGVAFCMVDSDFFANTEIEAIFKACNWILEKEIQEENRLQLQEDLTEYKKLIKEGL